MSIALLLVRLLGVFWPGCYTFFAHNIETSTSNYNNKNDDTIHNNQSGGTFIVGVVLCDNLIDGGGDNNLTDGKGGNIK